jgi:hypothetical protein
VLADASLPVHRRFETRHRAFRTQVHWRHLGAFRTRAFRTQVHWRRLVCPRFGHAGSSESTSYGSSPEQRHCIGYLALALLRAPAATAYLLDAIGSHGRLDAIAAARALATFKDDAAVAEQVHAAAQLQKDRAAREEIAALFA